MNSPGLPYAHDSRLQQSAHASTHIDIHWLEQAEGDLPTESHWLSANEKAFLNRLLFLKRRNDWRLGRWTAKQAVAVYLNLPIDLAALASIEIRAASSGAPEVFVHERPMEVSISLSHREGFALCTVGPLDSTFGCDLEVIEPRAQSFIADYFTSEEQTLIEQASSSDRSQLVALLWSAKESALKALRAGLRLDTRSVRVTFGDIAQPAGWKAQPPRPLHPLAPSPDQWRPLYASYESVQNFHGWWRVEANLVRTIVAMQLPVQSNVAAAA